MLDIYREMLQVALAQMAERDQRIQAMEQQLNAKVRENRQLTADLLRLLRKGLR